MLGVYCFHCACGPLDVGLGSAFTISVHWDVASSGYVFNVEFW